MESYVVTYKDLREGGYTLPDGRPGLAASGISPAMVETLAACPFVQDDTVAAYLVLSDGAVVGREVYFTTRIKLDDDILDAESASSLSVEPAYRQLAVGADIVMATFLRSRLFIGAGVSEMALPLDRKLKFHILEFPRLMQLRNAKPLLAATHLSWLGGAANLPVRWFNKFIFRKAGRLARKFQIEQVSTVPEWVDDIVTSGCSGTWTIDSTTIPAVGRPSSASARTESLWAFICSRSVSRIRREDWKTCWWAR